MLAFQLFQPWKAKLHLFRTVYEAEKFPTVLNAHFLQISAVENKNTFFLDGLRGTKRSRDLKMVIFVHK